MNIIDIQDQLKNFSEQQLISEMQAPTGSAPQFLVLSEIKRRKRVRDDFMKREAANQPTVAQEAIAASGVPQSGIMGMSEAMAPQAAVAEGGIGSIMPQSMRPQTMPAPTDDAIPMREGGVPLGIRQNNPGNIRPGAGFIGETGQGGGYAQFGSEEEGLRALARLLGTYSDEYGINTLRGLTSRYAPRSDNEASFDNYVSYLGEQLGMDPDEEFDLKSRRDELIPAIVGFEQGRDFGDRYSQGQISRAIEAAGTDDPEEVARILGGSDEPGIISKVASAINPISTAQAQGAGPVMTEVGTPQEIFDEMQANKGGVPFPSSLGELFALGRDANVPTSERVGSRQDLLGQARGEQQEYLEEILGDQITGESDEYKAHVKRARSAGKKPMSPSEYRAFFGRNVDVDGMAGDSPASRAMPFSDVGSQEATADFTKQAAEEATEAAMAGDSEAASKTVEDAKKEVERIIRASQRGAEEPGKRAEYLASLDDGRDSDDLGNAPTSTGGQGAASADGQNAIISNNQPSGTVSPLEQEILDLQKKLEKDRDTDKYLALAQAGLALMSSKDPTLLGALGEAGVSGLQAYREAQDRYNEGVVDLINAKAKLNKGSDKDAFDAGNAVTRLGQIERALGGADGMTLPDEDRARLLQERLFLQRFIGIPELTTGATSAAPAS
tara:strand:+ start:431 stop:2437 length:2007 start_codon:yes stop_codon:yes gene_type:complete